MQIWLEGAENWRTVAGTRVSKAGGSSISRIILRFVFSKQSFT
jgi:hypothetical protein